MSEEPKVYKIPAVNFERLREDIEKLNRRAAKLNTGLITLNVVKSVTRKCRNELLKLDYEETIHHCTVTGETPKLAGWTLVAILEPQHNAEMLIREVPGQKCPVKYRTTDMHCDHCMTTRRRSVIYVLSKEITHTSGKLKHETIYKQVGKQCLSDFLGGVNPEDLVAGAEYLMDFCQMASDAEEDDWGFRGRGQPIVPVHHFVSVVSIIIRRIGWVSRSKAHDSDEFGGGPTPTANIAWSLCLYPNEKENKRLIDEKRLHAEDCDVTLASQAIEWAKKIDPETAYSTYMHDLGVCCRQEYVTSKTSGFVASVVNSYQRELGRRLETAAPTKPPSQYVGEIKKRQVFEGLTIMKMINLEGQYPSTLVKFEDGQKNVLTWKASGCPDWLKIGLIVTVKATVEKHDEYKGVKETRLKRVVPEDVVATVEAE